MSGEKRNTWLYDDIGMWRVRWIIPTVVLGIVAAVCAVGSLLILADKNACATIADDLGVEYRYQWNTECRLKVDGVFVPESWLRINDDGEIIVERDGGS